MPFLNTCSCPNCGAEFEIELRPLAVQEELPLGPIEFSAPKKKLDGFSGVWLKSTDDSFSPSPKKSDSSNDSDESNRIDQFGEDLIGSVQKIVGDMEFRLNGQLWRSYLHSSKDALRYAIRKWEGLSGIQRRAIKHPPAWLTDRYKRARDEFARSQKRSVQTIGLG